MGEIKPTGGKLSRRVVVAGIGAAGVGLVVPLLAGCQATPTPSQVPAAPESKLAPPTASTAASTSEPAKPAAQPASAPSELPATTPTQAPTQPTATTSAQATPRPVVKVAGAADLVIVRGTNPADITRAAVEALGGMAAFIAKGSTIVVKPNICTDMAPEYAATTNPEVVATLIKMCKEAGAAKVKVLDYGWGSQQTNYKGSGIEDAVVAAGGEMVKISPVKWKMTKIPNGKLVKATEIYDDILTADAIINVPIAKQHNLTQLTLGMKNLMGTIHYREGFHGDIGQSVSDLSLVVRPTLTVLDAVRILTRNGPGGGYLEDVKQLDTVVASADVVAVDAYATSFFGMKPDDLQTIRAGQANGLGTSDLSKLKVAEVKRG